MASNSADVVSPFVSLGNNVYMMIGRLVFRGWPSLYYHTLKVDMWQVGKVVGPKPNLPDCLVRPWSYLVYAINSVEFDLEYVMSSVAVWIHPGPGTGPPPFSRVLPPWFRSLWFQQNMN